MAGVENVLCRPSNRFNDSAGTKEVSVLKAFGDWRFTQISNPHTALVLPVFFRSAEQKYS